MALATPGRPPDIIAEHAAEPSCFYHHFFFNGTLVGMQLRAATTTILYDKILRLSLSSLGQVCYVCSHEPPNRTAERERDVIFA